MGLSKRESRQRIHKRIRKNIQGTTTYPRLCVFRSNKGITCQLIDDRAGATICSASHKEVKGSFENRIAQAKAVGKLIAEKANSKNISSAVFDRGGYLYHGRVKALADAAREAGLNI